MMQSGVGLFALGVACSIAAIAPIPFQRWALARCAASAGAIALFAGGYAASKRAIAFQEQIDEAIAFQKRQQKLIREAVQPVVVTEAVEKEQELAELRKQDFKLDAGDAFATVQVHKRPEWVKRQLEPKPESQDSAPKDSQSQDSEPKGSRAASGVTSTNQLLGAELPVTPNLGVKFFDWKQFRETPDNFSHIRAVGATNSGKTTLVDWLMDVIPSDRKFVCTIKRKPHQWQFIEVIGIPEDYEAIRHSMLSIRAERIRRTAQMAKGIDFPSWSIAFDEWKAQSRNIKAVVERKTKEIISPSAKDLQGENLTLGRELKMRIFALAQGRQIITWGLQGESDLLECFCSIFLGKFAVEECESYRNKFPKDSEQYAKYQQVRDYLESLGNRAAWISCELGEFPAVVPDLSQWQRELPQHSLTTEIPVNSETSQATEVVANQETEDTEELWELAKKRLLESWNSDEVTAREDTAASLPNEADKVADEASEVLQDKDCSTAPLLPEPERSKALARVMALLGKRGSSEVERVGEAIALIHNQPDKALWLSLKILRLGVTASSRDVFGCGTGGKAFRKAKDWYDLLESTFGKIVE